MPRQPYHQKLGFSISRGEIAGKEDPSYRQHSEEVLETWHRGVPADINRHPVMQSQAYSKAGVALGDVIFA
jgi:hypothetical protein